MFKDDKELKFYNDRERRQLRKDLVNTIMTYRPDVPDAIVEAKLLEKYILEG